MNKEFGDCNLKIHKSSNHLFSEFISKRGFSFMQTRETYGEILSGNRYFLRPSKRLVTPYHCTHLTSFTFLCNKSIVFQIKRLPLINRRLALLLPLGPIICKIVKASAKQNFKYFLIQMDAESENN